MATFNTGTVQAVTRGPDYTLLAVDGEARPVRVIEPEGGEPIAPGDFLKWAGTEAFRAPAASRNYHPVPLFVVRTHMFVGVDLGQTSDPSTFCALESAEYPLPDAQPAPVQPVYTTPGYWGPVPPPRPAVVRRLAVRSLFRWPLHTSYVTIANGLKRALDDPDLKGADVYADETGVGRPICDLLRSVRPAWGRLTPVTITAGGAVSKQADGSLHTAKVALISNLLALLQSKRLRFAQDIPETPTLLKELEDYRVKVTAAGNETFNAREGAHDDLLLALALAAWGAEKASKKRHIDVF